VLVLVNAPVKNVPARPWLPLQAPLAEQLLALVEDHVKVLVPPLATLVGLAVKIKVGAGATVTVTFCVVVPPVPVQAKV
jgi:hypothetical protein